MSASANAVRQRGRSEGRNTLGKKNRHRESRNGSRKEGRKEGRKGSNTYEVHTEGFHD
jgi:hypothetical protein